MKNCKWIFLISISLLVMCMMGVRSTSYAAITLNYASKGLIVAGSNGTDRVQLNATLTEGDTLDNSSWKSDKPSIATVDNTGLVKAVNPGTAVISVKTTSGKTATCTINIPLRTVSVVCDSNSENKVEIGKNITFTAVIGTEPTKRVVGTWTIISGSGKIGDPLLSQGSTTSFLAKDTGEATIQFTPVGVEFAKPDPVKLTVVKGKTAIYNTQEDFKTSLQMGITKKFNVYCGLAGTGGSQVYIPGTWTCSNENVVELSARETTNQVKMIELTGKSNGTATITFTPSETSKYATPTKLNITVTGKNVTAIYIPQEDGKDVDGVVVGRTITLRSALGRTGGSDEPVTGTWSISGNGEEYVKLPQVGITSAVTLEGLKVDSAKAAKGEDTIVTINFTPNPSESDKYTSATKNVKVYRASTAIYNTLTDYTKELVMGINSKCTIYAGLAREGGSSEYIPGRWTCSNENVITLSARETTEAVKTITVTPKASGTVTITFTPNETSKYAPTELKITVDDVTKSVGIYHEIGAPKNLVYNVPVKLIAGWGKHLYSGDAYYPVEGTWEIIEGSENAVFVKDDRVNISSRNASNSSTREQNKTSVYVLGLKIGGVVKIRFTAGADTGYSTTPVVYTCQVPSRATAIYVKDVNKKSYHEGETEIDYIYAGDSIILSSAAGNDSTTPVNGKWEITVNEGIAQLSNPSTNVSEVTLTGIEGKTGQLEITFTPDNKEYTPCTRLFKIYSRNASIYFNGNTQRDLTEYTLEVGKSIKLFGAASKEFAESTRLVGDWVLTDANNCVSIDKTSNTDNVTLRGLKEGTVTIKFIPSDDNFTPSKVETIKVVPAGSGPSDVTTVDAVAKYNGNELAKTTETPTEVALGGTINVTATPTTQVTSVKYAWGEGAETTINGNSGTITIPTSFVVGDTYTLTITPYVGTTAYSAKKYHVKVSIGIDIEVTHNSVTKMKDGDSVDAKIGDLIEIIASPEEKVSEIRYVWDDKASTAWSVVKDSYAAINVPTQLAAGAHKLYVYATNKDGKMTNVKTYTFNLQKGGNTEDYAFTILPWEEQNFGAEGMFIALRNDSLSKKANKNVYALNEQVTYYIDFYNGGSDIQNAVTITLKLPLNFEVIDAGKGTVDSTSRTITWTYANGMEANYSGTKKVIIRYTAFSTSSKSSEKIYPTATIGTATLTLDESSVINLIYKNSSTVLDTLHLPYMYGDANATTFRPDGTITRAEGALVLVRMLYGQDTIDNATVTNRFPDIGQTYLEAQKAITVATNFGLINGYNDGYYRPNNTMTRAEFMKILATFIEKEAKNKGVNGIALKAINQSAKVYCNPVTEYIVNGTVVTEHWALSHVSLLTRLNMTPVSESEKDLRLDKGITRAEVAQLVNYYLLRAPADTSTNTYTGFSDVAISHKLIGDIMEATRNVHQCRITVNGKEAMD